MARPISASTERPHRAADRDGRDALRLTAMVVVAVGVAQAILFYDHFAVALTTLFGLGFGVWLRSWKAVFPAIASFAVGIALALVTGWLHDARLLWEPLLGVMLAGMGGFFGGGFFDVMRRDRDARSPGARSMGSF